MSESNTHQLQAKLEKTQQLLDESQSIANLGTWEWWIDIGKLEWSKQIFNIFGLAPDQFEATYEAFLNAVHPADRELVKQSVEQSVAGQSNYQIAHRIVRPTGEVSFVEERGRVYRNTFGQPVRMIGTVQDITEKHQHQTEMERATQQIVENEKQLHQLAYYDQLTGLPNRNYLVRHIDGLIDNDSRARPKQRFILAFLDLDGFKEINDTQGHDVGDRVLINVAQRLKTVIPSASIVVRLGGDEFAIVTFSDDIRDVSEQAAYWIEQLSITTTYNNIIYKITCSMGLVTYPEGATNLTELLKKADTAMHQAKATGKNKFQFYDELSAEKQFSRLLMQSELDLAIEQDQFEVFFQPKLSLHQAKYPKAEALIRWRHPQKGLISPAEFIPLAEDTGQIFALGKAVMHKTCELIKKLKEEYSLKLEVAVNLSVKQLLLPDLAEDLLQTLHQYSVEPELIELELTETAVMENIDNAKQRQSMHFMSVGLILR